jgi:F420-dependent oxidoreductase-like protein
LTSRIGVSVSLGQASNTATVYEMATLAESLGYESLWIPEAWGRDAFTLLAAVAVRTTSIGLATGIVNIFSRTPAIVAQSIASLDDISHGRAILGLGASGERVIERWHGLEFENVLQRTREFVEVVRAVLSGNPVNYNGDIYTLRGFSLAFNPPRREIPIYLASIGPANVRLTGELADGWLPIFASAPLLESARAWLSEGARRAARPVGNITVASYIPAIVGRDGPFLARLHIAYYVGAMGSYYHRLMVRSGWRKQADEIRTLYGAGRRNEAAEQIDDEMLSALAITGDEKQAREGLRRFRALGIDLPILAVPQGASPEAIHATLRALGG